MATHVPAWKRVGLKLKGDEDSAAPPVSASSFQPAWKKIGLRLKVPGAESVERPRTGPRAKRQKLENGVSIEPAETVLPEVPKEDDSSTLSTKDTPLRVKTKKRKSVSFADGAKLVDGPSSPDRLFDFDAEDDGEGVSTEAVEEDDQSNGFEYDAPEAKAQRKIEKRRKRDQRRVSADSDAGIDVPRKQRQFLQYLLQYHNDRDGWKFNKSQQTKVLVNAFNLYRIPREHDAALVEYIRGLQGKTARVRMREDAEKIVAAAADGEVEAARAERAKALLQVLAEDPPPADGEATSKPVRVPKQAAEPAPVASSEAPDAPRKRIRGRKRRTVELSSSSSSSSESSSEFESD